MKNIVVFFITILVLGCASNNTTEKKITIAAAASTQFAMKKLADGFTKNTGIKVDVITSSSGKLTTQILNGAPYDLFFSANMKYPEAVTKKGKAISSPTVYAYGVPVVWTMDTTINLNDTGSFLLNHTVEKIAVAEKKNAPYGEMAIQFLSENNIYEQLKTKLVYGESISQVNEYIMNKSVEVGFTAKSIVCSPKLKNRGKFLELGQKYWIAQGMVTIKNETPDSLKLKFVEYLESNEGIETLNEYGYIVQ